MRSKGVVDVIWSFFLLLARSVWFLVVFLEQEERKEKKPYSNLSYDLAGAERNVLE
jgi:hypothetical protein